MLNTEGLKELQHMYVRHGPTVANKDFIQIECRSQFEPHGRASETWETIWKLHLPHTQGHSKYITGWQPLAVEKCQSFKGRTLNAVLNKAVAFGRALIEEQGGIPFSEQALKR